MPGNATPVCSIIIPTRNCIDYLPTALRSIEMQEMSDLEIIVVDDGSTDGTGRWLETAPLAGKGLKVISTGGVGVVRARNQAVAEARSDLVAFLDADDYWWPGKLKTQIAFHRRTPEAGFSFTDYLHITPDGRTHGTCFEFWRCAWGGANGDFGFVPDPVAGLLATNVVGTSTVMARKAILEQVGGFSLACKSAEDWDLWLRMAQIASVGCSAMVSMTYLMRPDGETSARKRRIEAMAAIIAQYDSSAHPSLRAAVQQAKGRLATAQAEVLQSEGQSRAAAAEFLRALWASPSPRNLRAAMAGGLEAAASYCSVRKRVA